MPVDGYEVSFLSTLQSTGSASNIEQQAGPQRPPVLILRMPSDLHVSREDINQLTEGITKVTGASVIVLPVGATLEPLKMHGDLF